MNTEVLTTIAVTGFSVAFFHAAIPTHWLPFVLAARVRKWNKPKTLLITTLAGGGHVLFTAILGFFIAWLGIALNERIGHWFPWIAGGALAAFGLYYVIRQLRGKGHGHSHDHGGHPHVHDAQSDGHEHTRGGRGHVHETTQPTPQKSDWAAITSLLALLTFSPCEGFLPVYVSGARYGWSGFLLLTLVLSLATIAGMVVFTWLTLAGMEKLKLAFIEKYEQGILGGLLCLLGIFVIVFEH